MQLPKHHVLIGCAVFDRVISFPTCQIKSNFAKKMKIKFLDDQSCKNPFVGETHHLIFVLTLLALSIEVYFNWLLLLLKSIKNGCFSAENNFLENTILLFQSVFTFRIISLLSNRINNSAKLNLQKNICQKII
jgi:hypothetical protein